MTLMRDYPATTEVVAVGSTRLPESRAVGADTPLINALVGGSDRNCRCRNGNGNR
jgi:hypothetical protein